MILFGRIHAFWACLTLLVAASVSAREDAATLTHYERLVLASCAVLEAASEGPEGMQAVLNVIHNRAGGDVNRVMGVVARPRQFAALDRATASRHPDYGPLIERATQDRLFSAAFDMVLAMEAGRLPDITGGADHYHAVTSEAPYWADTMQPTRQIGAHRFYRSQPAPLLAQAN